MSVIIRGMKMPKSCFDCPCILNMFFCEACDCRSIIDESNCTVKDDGINMSRPDWCPLIEYVDDISED